MTEKGEIRVEPVPSGANIHVETGIRMHLGWVIKAKETRWLLDEVKVFLGRLPPGIMDNASSHA